MWAPVREHPHVTVGPSVQHPVLAEAAQPLDASALDEAGRADRMPLVAHAGREDVVGGHRRGAKSIHHGYAPIRCISVVNEVGVHGCPSGA